MSEAGRPTEMRQAFAQALVELGSADSRIVVLDNDVGLTTLSDQFRAAFPDRYIDIGIAEKNLFGTAAGLAASGLIAFPTTFAVFATRCALDQVSISIAATNLDVKIPGHYIGGSRAGASHIAIEDLAVFRSLPNMRVADPADNQELRAVMKAAVRTPGPVYFRVSKLAVADVLEPGTGFEWGMGHCLRQGRDVTLFGTGLMTTMCLAAARLLAAEGVEAEVVHLGSIKPIDEDLISASAARTGAVVTAELASINGGLGSAVAEVLGERQPVPLRRIGYRDVWPHSGSINQILEEVRAHSCRYCRVGPRGDCRTSFRFAGAGRSSGEFGLTGHVVARYDGLKDAVVVVTGAGRGLGQALAEAFAAQAARLVVVDVDEAGLAATVQRLQLPDARVLAIAADLRDTSVLDSIVDQAVATFGGIDVLVNNAAVVDGVPLDEVTAELFDQVVEVNLRAPLFLSRAALRAMRAQGGGRIVNVASMAARTGGAYPTVFCYAATKAGLLALTRSFAKLGAPDNVLVNAVLPSNIDSPMLWGPFASDAVRNVLSAVPLGRAAQPTEVSELVLWLASPASSYVTGVSWDINGGWFMS